MPEEDPAALPDESWARQIESWRYSRRDQRRRMFRSTATMAGVLFAIGIPILLFSLYGAFKNEAEGCYHQGFVTGATDIDTSYGLRTVRSLVPLGTICNFTAEDGTTVTVMPPPDLSLLAGSIVACGIWWIGAAEYSRYLGRPPAAID